MKIELGNSVTDAVTGFHGIVVARAEYLNGCVRFGVQPKVTDKGKLPCWEWIDEQQLEVFSTRIERGPVESVGGPHQEPPKF